MSSQAAGPGRLIVVATPIGNLGDLAPRAAAALAEADVIACEDTRRTRGLLTAAGIAGQKLMAVHDANEAQRAAQIVNRIRAGETVVLVSDAGTPAVSDPGRRVVAAVVEAGGAVVTVPGPSAVIAALVVSGLATDRFVFEGFLPRKGGDRTRRLAELAAERRTSVFYEAPHRVARTLLDMANVAGPDRRVALARELTKVHEEVWRGTLAEAATHLATMEPRGEYVVVVEGAPAPDAAADAEIDAALVAAFAAGQDRRTAVVTVVATLGTARRRVYERALTVERPSSPGAPGAPVASDPSAESDDSATSPAHTSHTARPR